MLYAKKQKTIGGFYNIYEWKLKNGVLHQERICSFYEWELVVLFMMGYAETHDKQLIQQQFISGKVVLSIKD